MARPGLPTYAGDSIALIRADQQAPMSVLLVEDDDGDAMLVNDFLQDAAPLTQVHRVGSVSQALERLTRAQADPIVCILLDLGLPDTIGLSGIQALRQAAPSVALIVLTGLDDQHMGNQAVIAGAQDYLVKGNVDGQLLDRAIRYSVQRQRADEQERQLLESSLQTAENSRLERGLLPSPVLRDRRMSVLSRYRPGSRRSLLGGDFLDVVEDASGAVHLLIGDVAGHGPDEAALGVCLRIAWRTLVLAGFEPDQVLAAVQQVLVNERDTDEDFATVCTVTIHAQRTHADLRLAGHPTPLLVGSPTQPLPEGQVRGPALGITDQCTHWPAIRVPLITNEHERQQWRLLLFTDGLVEGSSGQGKPRLGVEGLIALLNQMAGRAHLPGFLDELIEQVGRLHGEELPDDVAALMVSWSAS